MFEDEDNDETYLKDPGKIDATTPNYSEVQSESPLPETPVTIHALESHTSQQQIPNFHQIYSDIQHVAILVITNDGTVIYCNPTAKQMISWSRDCLIGENYQEFIQDFHNLLPAMEAFPERTMVSEQVRKVFIPHCDESLIPCNITISTSVELGDLYKVISLQDLRQEKKFEAEKAVLAQRAKELSTVTHELRSAVHGILGACELLEDYIKKLENSSGIEALNQTHKIFVSSTTQLTDVTNAYLSGKRISKNFSIKTIMEETYTILLGMQQKSNPSIKLLLDIPAHENLELVHGDPLAIKQIILNIAGNAIKFTKVGVVRIGLHIENQNAQNIYYKLSIQDTGPGLDEDARKKMWTPRNKVHSPNQTQIKGTGLGLSITQDIVTQLEGTIDTQSTIGKGTTISIYFSLPRAKLEEHNTAPQNPTDVKSEKSSTSVCSTLSAQSISSLHPSPVVLKRRILAVDDTAINLQLLIRYFLNHSDYILSTVSSGEEAIEHLKTNDCDAILMDQQMPLGLSGLQTAIAIRNSVDIPKKNVPIIFTSADDDKEWKNALDELQFISFLPKPAPKKDIFEAITLAISKVETTQQNTTNKKPALLTAFDVTKNLSAPLPKDNTLMDPSKPKDEEQLEENSKNPKTETKNN